MRIAIRLLLGIALVGSAPPVTEAAPRRPLVPSTLTATPLSATAIRLNWNDPNTSETNYAIERSVSAAGGFTQIATVLKNIITYQNNGLTAGTTYYYRIRATGRRGAVSEYSNVASAATPAGDTTPPSVSLSADPSETTYTSAKAVVLTAAASDNVGVTRVEFYDGATLKATDTSAPYTHDWAITAAANGAHSWTAKAFDAAGNTRTSAALALTVNIDATVPTISGVSAINVTTGGATIVWTTSESADTQVDYGLTTGYGSATALNPALVTNHSVALSGLNAGTLYHYHVKSRDAAGNLAVSGDFTLTTTSAPDTTRPSVPSGLSATSASCSQINLSWTASTDTGGSGLRGYNLYRGGSFLKQVLAPATTTSDLGLAQNTTYSYEATAVDNAGNESARSSLASANTPWCDATPPSVPTNLSATPVSCGQINLSWAASTDTGGSGLLQYDVYRDGAFLKQVPVPAVSTMDSGLNGDTGYSYSLRAADQAGNQSGMSSPVSTTTPSCGGSTGAHVWSQRMGGLVLADGVIPKGIAVDGAGNVAMAGHFMGTVNLGNGPVTSAGRTDLFVAKYSAAGTHLWSRRFGDAADQFGMAVAADAGGNVYVTGQFFGTVDFGGGPLTGVGYDIFLAKYAAATGAHLWSKRIGGASYEQGQAIVVDNNSGHVLVAGQFASAVDFGTGPLTSAGGYDGFVAKYTSTTGAPVWAKRFGGPSLDTATGLGVDVSGNPTVAGYFAGTADFEGAPLTSAGANDLFVVRYSAAGSRLGSPLRFGDAEDQRTYAAAVDGAGNVVLTGYFYGSVNFGGSTLTNVGGTDIFLAKLSAAGGHLWSKQFGTSMSLGEVGEDVAIDAAGNIVLTGEIIRDVNFGGGALPAVATYDVFVAKFSPAGLHQWSKRIVGAWDDHGNAVAIDGQGNALLGGDFADAVNFGGSLLSSPGGSDGFLVKLEP